MTVAELKDNWLEIRQKADRAAIKAGRKPEDVLVLAVSKTHDADVVKMAMEAGISVFGENYVQELTAKQDALSAWGYSPEWHFIGHLQTNKVKYIAPFVRMIQTVDSFRLAEEIEKQAVKNSRKIDILLQVNTSQESSKSGFDPTAAIQLMNEIKELPSLTVKGLMTIGTFSEDERIYRKEFKMLREISEKLKMEFPEADLRHLSMGMTHDFEAAIEEGATIVRVGTAIFGSRYYA